MQIISSSCNFNSDLLFSPFGTFGNLVPLPYPIYIVFHFNQVLSPFYICLVTNFHTPFNWLFMAQTPISSRKYSLPLTPDSSYIFFLPSTTYIMLNCHHDHSYIRMSCSSYIPSLIFNVPLFMCVLFKCLVHSLKWQREKSQQKKKYPRGEKKISHIGNSRQYGDANIENTPEVTLLFAWKIHNTTINSTRDNTPAMLTNSNTFAFLLPFYTIFK